MNNELQYDHLGYAYYYGYHIHNSKLEKTYSVFSGAHPHDPDYDSTCLINNLTSELDAKKYVLNHYKEWLKDQTDEIDRIISYL
ncbi:hypothetical protein phiOC_p183 [Ochrobactrum phage vB_OspM_OC]|nr:hypothetical protein phiOC_p183 [Ochrobactrum phage vB_OspM_OC]